MHLYIPVNYKNKKRYKLAKYPIRQPLILAWLIHLISRIGLMGQDYKIEKINMEGLKGGYFLLSNHMYFIDFLVCAVATGWRRVNNVVSFDGYYRRPWLMELIGSIGTRKYVMDLHLIKSINRVLKRGDILSMYPEARYTPAGITNYLPESLGKLIKMNKAPVVVMLHHGNHLYSPFWDFRHKRKAPLRATMTQILTAEQVKAMSVEEINAAVLEAMQYDDYQWQKDNHIRITEPFRAQGLHKVLYQCPHCKVESEMASEGAELYCKACGKRWLWQEDGYLKAVEGETEFDHIPDWYLWQRTQVEEQIEKGEYVFEDEVDIYSLPRSMFTPLGRGKLTHDPEKGWIVQGHYRGKDYYLNRHPNQTNSLHVEYDYCYIRPEDCVDISTEDDSFYCYPVHKRNVITKLAFATEILYQKSLKR